MCLHTQTLLCVYEENGKGWEEENMSTSELSDPYPGRAEKKSRGRYCAPPVCLFRDFRTYDKELRGRKRKTKQITRWAASDKIYQLLNLEK